jgi:hypothetical protein
MRSYRQIGFPRPYTMRARFEQSPIRVFVPLLVERRARAELAGAIQ